MEERNENEEQRKKRKKISPRTKKVVAVLVRYLNHRATIQSAIPQSHASQRSASSANAPTSASSARIRDPKPLNPRHLILPPGRLPKSAVKSNSGFLPHSESIRSTDPKTEHRAYPGPANANAHTLHAIDHPAKGRLYLFFPPRLAVESSCHVLSMSHPPKSRLCFSM